MLWYKIISLARLPQSMNIIPSAPHTYKQPQDPTYTLSLPIHPAIPMR